MRKEEIPLTVIDPELERLRNNTHPGMAFWSGTGPAGTTCRECINYDYTHSYYSANSKHGDTLKPGPCRKYGVLMGRVGPSVPYNTPSCKYFEDNLNAPPIRQPQRN